MKALVVGRGSMGKRRVRNLRALEDMNAFLAVKGKATFPNRYRDERGLLSIVVAAERRSAEGTRITLEAQ